jgi:hypothetical protein
MNPLFYDNPLLLNARQHADVKLKSQIGRGFARKATAVPLTLVEFPQASRFFPICFARDTGQPMAVLGVRAGENLFIDADGEWKNGAYIPAYVRRYPFILVETAQDQVALAMEDDREVLADEDGWALFEDGKPTERGRAALEFCRTYKAGVEATEEWVAALSKSGLLVERRASFEANSGENAQVRGFNIVDEERLRKLDGATLADWNQRGWLAPIFAHLASMNIWAELFSDDHHRAAAAAKVETPPAPPPPATKGKGKKPN